MSHDRGCPCGREKWEYDECSKENCYKNKKTEQQKRNEDIEKKCIDLIRFIATDFIELSYDKAYWQRDDWKKRCNKLMEEIYAEYSKES